MRNLLGYLVVLLLQGCGLPPNLFNGSYKPSQALKERRDFYLSKVEEIRRPSGWFSEGCDSLMRDSLLVAGGVSVPIEEARNKDGQWFRRSLDLPECLASKGSKSTISRDMIMGLLWFIWTERRLDLAEELWDYGQARSWKIGESDGSIDGIGRTIMTPTLLASLAQVIYKLGGSDHDIRHMPFRNSGFKRGYTQHLELLDIILWQEMTGKIRLEDKLIVEGYLLSDPENAMIVYAAGRYRDADSLLLRQHPAARLPTSKDTCSPLTYEHVLPNPCPRDHEIHPPIHFLFLSKLLISKSGKTVSW